MVSRGCKQDPFLSPILTLADEATANVDPENEDRLQKAIEALTRDKTIIMIVQQRRHEELISQKGIYADFVLGRKEAIGWNMCGQTGCLASWYIGFLSYFKRIYAPLTKTNRKRYT